MFDVVFIAIDRQSLLFSKLIWRLLDTGEAYSFGNGIEGRLGLGDLKHRLEPHRIPMLNNMKVSILLSDH